jgi:Retrotransposon gag protein/Zinc knuckle
METGLPASTASGATPVEQTLQAEIIALQAEIAALHQRAAQSDAQKLLGLSKIPSPEKFTGDKGSPEVDTWLFELEQRFEAIPGIEQAVCIQYATYWLAGSARLWWRALPADQRPSTWPDFKTAITAQFQPLDPVLKARQQLHRCRQTTSVANYTTQLRAIFVRIPDISESEKYARFLEGLKPAMQQKVVEADVSTFEAAARVAERADMVTFSYRRADIIRPVPQPRDGPTPMELGATETRPGRAVTEADKARYRREGHCFTCGATGHVARDCRDRRRRQSRGN